MSPEIAGALACLTAYLLGSIPFGIIVSRVFGATDPRRAGSRNIGSTNAMRVSGRTVGALTLIGDAGKGWLVGWVAAAGWMPTPWPWLAVLSVVLGHLFPVFIKFRGGKGVATGLGCVIGLHAPLGLVLAVVWAAAVGVWRHSSSGALAAFAAFPLLSALITFDWEFTIFSLLLSALIIVRHTDNIRRLRNGTEPTIN